MNIRLFIGIILLAAAMLPGCGKSDDEAADPNAPATMTLSASRSVILADGSDAVAIQAAVAKADGTAADDGTLVNFSAPGSVGVFSAAAAPSAGGIASVTMTHPAISGADNRTIMVTASAGGAAAYLPVKCISQPAYVEVSIALNQPASGVGLLQFTLNNSAGASFSNADPQRIVAINEASGSLVTGNFDAAGNRNVIGLVNPTGFDPVAGIPIIRATYAVAAGSGLPAFSIASSGTFTIKDALGNALSTQLTVTNLVVTAVYDTE